MTTKSPLECSMRGKTITKKPANLFFKTTTIWGTARTSTKSNRKSLWNAFRGAHSHRLSSAPITGPSLSTRRPQIKSSFSEVFQRNNFTHRSTEKQKKQQQQQHHGKIKQHNWTPSTIFESKKERRRTCVQRARPRSNKNVTNESVKSYRNAHQTAHCNWMKAIVVVDVDAGGWCWALLWLVFALLFVDCSIVV